MMKFSKGFLALVLAAMSTAESHTARAQGELDLNIAYKLAAASYCAYAVEDLEEYYGRARAAACLRSAAKSDPRLNSLSIGDDKVEAFASDKDAYLLIDTSDGVILAFRGTLAPSLALRSPSLQEVAGRVIFSDDTKLREELMTFARDWVNDAFIGVDGEGRHSGFYGSWRALRAHLEKACAAEPQRDCSVSGSFMPPVGARKKLFITGHSKGGAVALMAALDPSRAFANAEKPLVYTFASAKGVDISAAEKSGEVGRTMWRLEQDGDVVPSLPTDKTPLLFLSRLVCGSSFLMSVGGKRLGCYAHVGRRAVFKSDGQLDFPGEPKEGVDLPGDLSRLRDAATGAAFDWVSKIVAGDGDAISRLATSNDNVCRLLVDRHFAVFSAVQKHVWSSDPSRPAGTDFFAAGVAENGKPALWGYTKWCDLVAGKN